MDDVGSIEIDEETVLRLDQDVSYLEVAVNRAGVMQAAGRLREGDADRLDLRHGWASLQPRQPVEGILSFD